MTDDPAMEPAALRRATASRRATARRRRSVIAAGHAGHEEEARRGLADPEAAVRAAALGALARLGELSVADVALALTDDAAPVRRRAPDAALSVRGRGSRSRLHDLMVSALSDADPLVVVGAAWFLAEHRAARAVPALMATAHGHDDVRCREGAVAALGAIGDGRGLSAVIDALEDKPTVRRRATVALAGFDDPRAELALQRAARDRDWQVRQAADELRRVDSSADNASADEPAPDDSAPDDKPAGDPDVSRRR